MRNVTLVSISVLFAAFFGSCNGNTSGDVAATAMGDVSNPPAERRDFDADVKAACGSAAMRSAGARTILRQPYLQKVRRTEATVVWTSLGGQQEVKVAFPDGIEVGRFAAQVDESAELPEGRQQVAAIEGLEAGTLYCYTIVEGERQLTDPIGFTTAPERGRPIDFLVVGDSGDGGSDQQAVLDQMVTVPFDLIVHVGDMAYDSGTLQQFEGKVFDMYSELLKHFPIFPASGNHEYETADAEPFRDVFVLPRNGGAGGIERWYSYDWGDIHFVVLDTERISDAQAAWLDQDLAATDRPWKIVYMHRPPYSSGDHKSHLPTRKAFSPIFEKHGVQLVLAGHDHHYERMKPQNGVHYVISGGGGRGTRGVTPQEFTAFSEQVLNFLQVRVEGHALVMHAIDATGQEFDSLRIENPAPERSAVAPTIID